MTMLDSAKCPAEFVGLRAWGVRSAAKRVLMAVAFGVTSSVALIHAEEPPGLVQEKQAPPVRDGFARGGGRGQWHAPEFIEDRKWLHFLLDNRAKIRRTITRTDDGVNALTESDEPEVTGPRPGRWSDASDGQYDRVCLRLRMVRRGLPTSGFSMLQQRCAQA